jgi:CRISPR-associated protein Cas1
MDNLRALPKLRDGLSHIYLEHCRVDRHHKSVSFHDAEGETPIPASSLALLMLGPGTSITHAALKALADNNCLVIWCGEENVRFYASGMGGTRSAAALIEQARLVSDPAARMEVVKRMYQMRFDEELEPDITLQQIRGKEGMRVRAAYREASKSSGVPWAGRDYDRGKWGSADPVNRALSAANSCLYGLCHAAILSAGFSPALGFIHTGKQRSFVYDIADLYKTEITIPLAFDVAKTVVSGIEREVRIRSRDKYRETRLLQCVIPDIFRALGLADEQTATDEFAEDPAQPTDWWDPKRDEGEGLIRRLM